MTDYKKTQIEKQFEIKNLYSVHYFKYGKNFSFEGEKHDFWELVYIDSGTAKITADDREFLLERGSMIFHQPGQWHNIKPAYDHANSVIISFDLKSEAEHFFDDKMFILNPDQQLILNRIITEASICFDGKINDVYMQKLVLRPSAPPGSLQVIADYLELLLIYLYRGDHVPVPVPQKGEKEELVYKIERLLSEKLYDSISLDYIANELYFSKTHIKDVFKKATGKTIIAYYNELKTEEAKRLIACGKYTFTQIAVKLGYSSIQYFSEKFKSETGLTPGEYASSIKVNNVL